MFLHIGGDVEVPLKDIIAICDMDSATLSRDTREFLKNSEEEGFVKTVGEDIPKTFVVAESNNRNIVYLTAISSVTLLKRANVIKGVTNYLPPSK